MKRLVLFALVLNAALLGIIAHQLVAIAGGGDIPTADRNGDVNGDARLDMSDAVYLLLHIFRNGPEPVALADSPEMQDRVSRMEENLQSMENNFEDLSTNLRSRASDLILFADGIQLRGTVITPSNPNECGRRAINCEEAGFESAQILHGGEISAEEGRLYFETDHQADVMVEMPSWRRGLGGEWWNAALYFSHGNRRIEAVTPPTDRGGPAQLGYSRLILPNLPAGQHYIEVDCSVMLRCDNLGQVRNWSSSLPSMTIRYLN